MAYAASASGGGRAARCSRVVALFLLLLCVALPVSQAFTLPGTFVVVRTREGGREEAWRRRR